MRKITDTDFDGEKTVTYIFSKEENAALMYILESHCDFISMFDRKKSAPGRTLCSVNMTKHYPESFDPAIVAKLRNLFLVR